MSKQSSVEWLQKAIYDKLHMKSDKTYEEIIDEAKAMHKEEIVDAHVNGNKEYTIGGGYELIAEHYYNEIFGSNHE